MGVDRRRLLGLGSAACGLGLLEACSGRDSAPSGSASGGGQTGQGSSAAGSSPAGPSAAGAEEITAALDEVVARYPGIQMALVVRDQSGRQLYSYDPDLQTIEGSVVKVPIALTVLRQHQEQGSAVSEEEADLLRRSLGESDNWCTLELFQRLGGGQEHSVPEHEETDAMPTDQQDRSVWPAAAAAVNQTYALMGITGTQVDGQEGWGGDQTTAGDLSRVAATLLQGPDWVRSADLERMLSWMRPRDDSQTWGVGGLDRQAPEGHSVQDVHVKNGWINDAQDVWSVNSEGTATVDGTGYALGLVSQGYSLRVKSDEKVWQEATSSLVRTYFQKALG